MIGPLRYALNRLESHLQAFIEGGAALLFPGGAVPRGVTAGLIEAMQAGVLYGADGHPTAPNQYQLRVSLQDVELLRKNQPFLDELTRLLSQACQEADLKPAGPLSLTVEGLPGLEPGEVRVVARNSLQDVTPTAALVLNPAEEDVSTGTAYLIVDGVTTFLIEQTVINIGRRPDNQLVIDDARISRLHAQLRLMRGHYVIFDLDSTGGTFVNGKRIHQQVLIPGDVISLAGVPIIFGQERVEPDETQEVPIKP